MSTILVTGGGGFIGSALIRSLQADGHKCVTIDNLSTGYLDNIPKNCEYIFGDCQSSDVISKLNSYQFDAIYHIAGQSSGEISFEKPIYDLQTNTQSTLMLLDYARRTGCKKFIYASSMSVYGDHIEERVNETSLTNPKSFYAVGKLASERYMNIYSKEYDIQCTALRFFNVYGIGQNMENLKQGMISIYLSQAIKNHHIVVKGSADRFRDFVYISDVVEALKLILKTNGHNFNIYNVSTGVKKTVSDVITKIQNLLPYDISVEYIAGTPGDQHGIVGDNNKIKSELGFNPKIRFDKGIQLMVKWAIKNSRDDD